MARLEFPTNLIAFHKRFSTVEACQEYLMEARWPKGFACPKCAHTTFYSRKDRPMGLECGKCGKITSITSGTIMHNSKLPLTTWFWAAWFMVSSKGGISALELSRQFGLSRETGFTLLHKLRYAMVAPERSKLWGKVQIDESWVGGKETGQREGGRGKQGRGALTKSLVVGAVEEREHKPGRLRLRQIPDSTTKTLHRFIKENVEPGSVIVTDGNPAYNDLPGYIHQKQVNDIDISKSENLPYYHTAISNLKAWLRGTHHGAVRNWHLQAYLNEFAFRYNRRNNLGAAFARLLELTPLVGTMSNDELYGDEHIHKNPGFSKKRR